MDSPSQSKSQPPKSTRRRRRRKHKGRKSDDTMAIASEPGSPDSFSWRLERRTVASPSPPKSHGIAPSRFHAKFQEAAEKENNASTKPTTNTTKQVPAWKAQIEHNLLVQQQKAHTGKLEARRKEFRKTTQLKTWPLQDMALEHLDHLLGSDASRQFHGGDYLSAESSSSVSSAETSKPRLAPRAKSAIQPKKETESSDKVSTQQSTNEGEGNPSTACSEVNNDQTVETNSNQPQHAVSPLWSLEPRIFATEKGNGKRKYLVGEFGRIADWYWRKTAPTSRHLYEVIREGSPCRLYFDLEFAKSENPGVNEVRLLWDLQDELATELELHYGQILPRLQSSQIVNLDSSNEKKFSRHWIVHLYGHGNDDDGNDDSATQKDSKASQEFLFKDAPTVGRFVKRMVGRLADDLAADAKAFSKKRPTLAKHLFVNTKDPAKKTCFIDLGVYTRNRLFRCLGSSKKGKSTKLQVVLRERDCESNEETVSQPRADIDKETEKESSSTAEERCYFPLSLPDKKEIEPSQSQSSNTPSMDAFIAGNDWEPHAQALADSLVVPLKSLSLERDSPPNQNPNRILDVKEGATASNSLAGFTESSRKASNYYPPATSMARQGSPIPALDKYVAEHLATRGGVRGSIRAWSIEYGHRDTPVSFTYHLQRNRFCEMVGRSHKSNNVFWTIDLGSWTCIQGCHDPECFGRGSPIPISNNKIDSNNNNNSSNNNCNPGQLDRIQQEFDSWQEEEFEKALGELNLDDIIVGKQQQQEEEEEASTNESKEEEQTDADDFSDEALLQAIVDNPELFP